MPRRLVTLSLSVLAFFAVAARKPDHPKHENHYKAVSTPAVDGLTMSLDRAESQQEFLKLAATLTNTTADRLFLVPADEGTFVMSAGELASTGPSVFGKALVVVPPGDRAKFETNIVIPASDADMQFVTYNLVYGDAFKRAADARAASRPERPECGGMPLRKTEVGAIPTAGALRLAQNAVLLVARPAGDALEPAFAVVRAGLPSDQGLSRPLDLPPAPPPRPARRRARGAATPGAGGLRARRVEHRDRRALRAPRRRERPRRRGPRLRRHRRRPYANRTAAKNTSET